MNRHLTHVLIGNKGAADPIVQWHCCQNRCDGDREDQCRVLQRPHEHLFVAVVNCAEQPAIARLGFVVVRYNFQKARAQHRCQRETDEHRHHDRESHRPSEGIDESRSVARHERDRQKDNYQRKRRRHDGQRDFLSGLNRCVERCGSLFFDVPEDILQHHNGVIDHDADGKCQPEQGHVVQREIHGSHQTERCDNRGGNSQRGNDHGPQIAHEEKNDCRSEQAAPQEMLFERRDRCTNECGIVADDRHRHPGRQRAAHAN